MRQSARHTYDGEPSLDELLADPILHRLLDCDGVDEHALLDLVAEARARLETDGDESGESDGAAGDPDPD